MCRVHMSFVTHTGENWKCADAEDLHRPGPLSFSAKAAAMAAPCIPAALGLIMSCLAQETSRRCTSMPRGSPTASGSPCQSPGQCHCAALSATAGLSAPPRGPPLPRCWRGCVPSRWVLGILHRGPTLCIGAREGAIEVGAWQSPDSSRSVRRGWRGCVPSRWVPSTQRCLLTQSSAGTPPPPPPSPPPQNDMMYMCASMLAV